MNRGPIDGLKPRYRFTMVDSCVSRGWVDGLEARYLFITGGKGGRGGSVKWMGDILDNSLCFVLTSCQMFSGNFGDKEKSLA